MNMLQFNGIVESKFQRRQLSKLLKIYQFSSSEIKVRITTIPKIDQMHKFNYYEPNYTLRQDVVESIRRLRSDGYTVKVEAKIRL